MRQASAPTCSRILDRRRWEQPTDGGCGGKCSQVPSGGRQPDPEPEQKLHRQIFYLGSGLRRTARQAMYLSLIEAVSAFAALGTAFLIEVLLFFVALGLI